MSYSNDVKNELTRLKPNTEHELVALLSGIIRVNGTILIASGRELSLQITTENAAVARMVYSAIKDLFRMEARILIQRRTKLKKNVFYIVKVPQQHKTRGLLEAVGMISEDGMPFRSSILEDFTKSDPTRRAYIRGIFLGSGSLTDPQRSYHLEIVTQSEAFAESLIELVALYGIQMKMSYRKESLVVYLKESEQISDFLALIGAHDAVMTLENIRIQKGVRNQVNRLVNCETANLNKSVNAAMRQCAFIRLIQDEIGLEKLPPGLQQTAEARLAAPDVSLKELGEMLDPPVGKSGINHRMRRLEEIADSLTRKEGTKAGEQH